MGHQEPEEDQVEERPREDHHGHAAQQGPDHVGHRQQGPYQYVVRHGYPGHDEEVPDRETRQLCQSESSV